MAATADARQNFSLRSKIYRGCIFQGYCLFVLLLHTQGKGVRMIRLLVVLKRSLDLGFASNSNVNNFSPRRVVMDLDFHKAEQKLHFISSGWCVLGPENITTG